MLPPISSTLRATGARARSPTPRQVLGVTVRSAPAHNARLGGLQSSESLSMAGPSSGARQRGSAGATHRQLRPIMTFVHPKGLDDFDKVRERFADCAEDLKREHPELADAQFRGVHGTTVTAARSIVSEGCDLNRTGQNYDGYSLDGPGLYITDSFVRATLYANQARTVELEASATEQALREETTQSSPGRELQMIAIFEKPCVDDAGRRVSLDDNEMDSVQHLSGSATEVRIPPAAIHGDKRSFVAVPLPPFDYAGRHDVENKLHRAMRDWQGKKT